MKKILSAFVIIAAALLLTTHLKKSETEENKREAFEEEAAEQDGIQLAQEQDFRNTVDIKLGYVPKERLVAASEKMESERKAMRLNPSLRTNALTWAERGPNSDVTGPSNGNTRANNGITSGRIRAIWVDLADGTNKTVWVGGIEGGIWKTTDITASPATWTPVNDFMGSLAIASICQDPNNTNIMYAGTGEKAINLDAVRGGGVWKSTDHGLTWNLLANTTSFWNVSKIACDANSRVYVATMGNGAGLERSSDGGANWTNIAPAGLNAAITDMKISSTGRMHIICGYYSGWFDINPAGYRFSDDFGTASTPTWAASTSSFGSPTYNCELGVSGNILYALNSNSSFQTTPIYKSTDGGVNWATTTTSPPAASGTNDLSSGQAWYNIAVAVDPANGNNVIAGGLNCYRSTDGGATWTQTSTWVGTSGQYVHADQHFAVWNGSQVLVASDGGVFYSADAGVTFRDRNAGLRLKQFYSCAIHPTTPNYFLGGAQDNGVHQLTSAGLGSSVEVTGGDGALVHIDQDQPQYQFGSYVYNQYRRSTDGGNTWSSVNYSSSIGSFINPSDYDDYNNKLYAAGGTGQYVRWENPQTGNTFTLVSVPALYRNNITHVMVSPYTGNRVFLGTGAGKVFRVDNADLNAPIATDISGNTMDAGATVSCVAMGTDDNNLLATFSNYGARHVWVSTTGGGASGWTNITGNLPDIPVRWAMFYPYDNTKAILATEAGIYETSNINGTATVWTQSPNFPIVRTDMLQYRPSDGTIVAATHGRGMWSTQISVTNTYIKYSATALSRPESTTATVASGCTGYTDYTIYMTTNRAPSGTATATLSVSGGTAVQGVDFDFTTNGNFASPSNTVTLTSGSTTPQPVNIRIYDNPKNDVVSRHNFNLSYSLSGTTDAVPTPGGQSFSFTINDDDLPPSMFASPATYDVGSYTVNSSATSAFRSNQQKHRLQTLFRASDLIASGLSAGNISAMNLFVAQKNSTKPFTGFTISMAQTTATSLTSFITSGFTQVYTGDYSSVYDINSFAFGTGAGSSSTFSWDGTSNIVIQFCFDNSPAAADAAADVMQGSTPSASVSSSIYSNGGVGSGCALAAASTNTARVNASFTIAKVANTVETTLNATKTLTEAGSYDVYFYNGSKIMARIQNASGFNYGCTQVIVDRAGNGAIAFWNNNTTNYLATKTFHVVPTTNNTSGQYQITLYYTAAEKTAWEAATGQNWSNIQMVKVKSQISNYTAATPAPDGANAVEIVTPTLGTFGADYTITGTFSSGFSGFGVGIPGNNPLPITLVSFQGRLDNSTAYLNWSTSSEQNSKNFEVEKSTNGVNYYRIGAVNAAGNSSTKKDYSLTDNKLGRLNYYRLRMNDLDGRNKLSNVVLLQYNAAGQNLWVVNNPFKNYIDVRIAKEAANVKMQLINAAGNVVEEKSFTNVTGLIHWSLIHDHSAGTYVLHSVADGIAFTNKIVKQ